VTAQQHADAPYPYILIDLGTFGGPQSFLYAVTQILNNRGLLVGQADTALRDPDYPNGNPYIQEADPVLQHTFVWHKGVLTDLGALPGPNSSAPSWVNAQGALAGVSENGITDTLTGYIEGRAVLWMHGQTIDLGTLGGNESSANGMNDRGQVVGVAANTIPDSYSMAGWGTQTRTFLWQDGHMQDLGTLGGPDSLANTVNNRGQVAGWSYTSSISNPVTGVPPFDPFLWQDNHMQDLGTLGGTQSYVNSLNDRGEVVGQSNLAGDQTYHPFLWDGHALRDLGTLGGNNGFANWINDAGDVVGRGDLPGRQTHHAFLWRHGVMRDLGTLPGQTCSTAYGVNRWDQVVGNTGICGVGGGPPFLWQHGVLYDLPSLVAPSALQVTEANVINDLGEIAGNGVFPNGEQHVYLMVPTRLAESEGLTSNAPAPDTVSPATGVRRSSVTCAREPTWLHHPILHYRPPIC
jgi:probable HAF family extracellular repeat protein